MKRMRNLKGFTLIELIVVILILGILAAIAVIGYTNITDKANITSAVSNARQVATDLSVEATLASETNGAATAATVFEALDAAKLATEYPGIAFHDVDAADGKVSIKVNGANKEVVIDLTGQIAKAATTATVIGAAPTV